MSRSVFVLSLMGCLWAAQVLGPAAARASGEEDAERLAQVQALEARAFERWNAGDPAAALDLYREAHALWRLAPLSFMQARCLEALERPAEAVEALERALSEGPDDGLRGRIEQKLADLRERLATGRLVLLVEPAGATVSIDGTPRGEAPIPPLDVAPGRHVVGVTRPDCFEEERAVEVEGGREVTVKFVLRPLPVEPREVPPPTPWYESTWGWVSVGVGVAGLVTGATLLGVASSERDELRGLQDEDPVRSVGQRTAFSRWDGAAQKETAGYVMLGVGGAAAVSAAVLFALEGSTPQDGEGQVVTVRPATLPGGGLISLEGRF